MIVQIYNRGYLICYLASIDFLPLQYNLMIKPNQISSWVLILFCILMLQMRANDEFQSMLMSDVEDNFLSFFCLKCNISGVYCKKNIEYIASLPESGHFDFRKKPIQNNAYKIEKVSFEKVSVKNAWFEFPNQKQNSHRDLSGMLALPETSGKPINGLIVYFHPTIFNKKSIPSNPKQTIFQLVGGVYASANYAVLFPDFLGFGQDAQHVHPYVLYPQQNAKTATYLLNEVVGRLTAKYGNRTSLPLMATGYSQGGAYPVFFSACNVESMKPSLPYCSKGVQLHPIYQITAVAGLEGAYDLTGVINDFLFNNVGPQVNDNQFNIQRQEVTNLVKPGLAAAAILSYATYSKNPLSLSDALVKDFYDMKCTGALNLQKFCEINGHQFNIEEALRQDDPNNNGNVFQPIFRSALNKNHNNYTYISLSQIGKPKNSIYSLINPEIITQDYYDTLREATIVTYGDVTPHSILVFSLKKDSTVSPNNTMNFIKHNKSSKVKSFFLDNSKFHTCPEKPYLPVQIDHIGGAFVSVLFSLNFFNQNLYKYHK